MIVSAISHIEKVEETKGLESELIINGDKYLDCSCGLDGNEILGHTSQIVENAILEGIKNGTQFAKTHNHQTEKHKSLENLYNKYSPQLQEKKKIFYNSNAAIYEEVYKIFSINAFNKNITNDIKSKVIHITINGSCTKNHTEIYNNYYHQFVNLHRIEDLQISDNTVGVIIKYQQLDDTFIQETKSNIIEKIFSICDQMNIITCFDNSSSYTIPQFSTKADIIIIGNNMANGFPLFGLFITSEIYNLLQTKINPQTTMIDTVSIQISMELMQKIINENHEFEEQIRQMTNQMLQIQQNSPQIISSISSTNNHITVQITSQYKSEDIVKIMLQNKLIAKYSTHNNTIIISLPLSIKNNQINQATEIIKFSLMQAEIITF
ncbi:MAG: Aminotransferase class-III [Pseudomonadota bacterium]|jgi:acetylornithine/succinyldiaminopimelate/putrescine aminotransferase